MEKFSVYDHRLKTNRRKTQQKDNQINLNTGGKVPPAVIDFIPFEENGVQPYISEQPGWLGGIQFKIVQQ